MEKFLDSLIQTGTQVGLHLLYALVILIAGLKLSGLLVKWIGKGRGFQKLDASVQTFLKSFFNLALKTLVVITAAMVVGVPITAFITILASCGVAIGLALQGSLSNFAGGLMILVFKPFKVGHYIVAQGYEGTVQSISIFYTTLLTIDNKRVTLPNGSLTNSTVVNVTAEPLRRIDRDYSVSYNSDIQTVKQILLQAAREHPLVLQEPATQVCLTKHDESALVFQLRAWCKTEDYWTVVFAMNEAVKQAFDQNGISIPYPQMDVHLDHPQPVQIMQESDTL